MASDNPMRLTMPTDQLILEKLLDGRNVAINIAQEIDRTPGYINRRMLHLSEYRLVDRVGPAADTGLYGITARGVAALRLIDEFEPGREFERKVDARAESITVKHCCIIDRATETETETESSGDGGGCDGRGEAGACAE